MTDTQLSRLKRIPHIHERLLEARALIARPTRLVGTQLPRIHTCVEQRIALQVRRQSVVVTGDPHVAHQHVRKTPLGLLSYTPAIRQGFSYRLWHVLMGCQGSVAGCRETPVCRTAIKAQSKQCEMAARTSGHVRSPQV